MEKADFIKRLFALRVSKGASARVMSLSLGQSAGYINNIENGVNYPSMTVFFYICDYCCHCCADGLQLHSGRTGLCQRNHCGGAS